MSEVVGGNRNVPFSQQSHGLSIDSESFAFIKFKFLLTNWLGILSKRFYLLKETPTDLIIGPDTIKKYNLVDKLSSHCGGKNLN